MNTEQLSEKPDKKEVAKFLDVSDRMVSKYVAQGKLSLSYEKGATSDKGIYDREQVLQLKASRPDKAEREKPEPRTSNPETSLVPTSKTSVVPTSSANPEVSFSGPNLVQALIEKLLASEKPTVDLKDKMLLSLEEASSVSGLSVQRLREAAVSGVLKASKQGRGWKVRPKALEAFCEMLVPSE